MDTRPNDVLRMVAAIAWAIREADDQADKPRTAKVIAPTPVCSFHRGLRGCTGTEHRVSIVRRIPLVIACAGLGGEACPVVCWSS